ncbi:hypothetical protein TWF694_010737 [Orbilia ellipsospora]|uniref:Karyogamy protein n=1 Tax=Orbilia ellipsospora TaxID=2528407 RepID=A0AAV9X6X7_9PEZI
MAYSAHKSAIPPPSPSPYSRLPTPASSHMSRPVPSRSISTSVYGSSHPSPSRPSLPHQGSSYDSFAPQPCPSPSPTKIPGFGLQRSSSTMQSSHKRQSSTSDRSRTLDRPDDGLMRAPSTSSVGYGYNSSRVPGSIRRDSLAAGDTASSAALRTPSRSISQFDHSSERETSSNSRAQLSNMRRPSQLVNLAPEGREKYSNHGYDNQASPAAMRKSLGLLGEPSPGLSQLNAIPQLEDAQLMPPPPPSLIRQLSSTSSAIPLSPVILEAPSQSITTLKPPTPPPQIPTPSPRKGTHIRAQSHVIASKPPPRTSSTRPVDTRPTSTVGRKVTGPPRPASTLHDIPSARPRAVSHNAVDPRRIATPANDITLPKGARQATGRTIAPPRPTSSRPNEPVVPSSASTRRPTITSSRTRPPSSHMPPPPVPIASSSKGSDTESSIRSESAASTTSNTSSARSDTTTRPRTSGRAAGAPPSPNRTSPIRGHKKAISSIAAAKPSKPSFNTFKIEYQQAPSAPKPATASLINQSQGSTASALQSSDTIHAQTKLLQLAILHAGSFNSTAALKLSARNKLYQRFSEIRDRNAAVAESHRKEQELVDLYALSLVLKKSAASSLSSLKDKLSHSPEENIQLLSEQLSKVLGWFSQGQYEGEYTRMTRTFEEWVSLPDEHERKVDGLGAEFARDILRIKRKIEMAVRSLEGWMGLVADGERSQDESETARLKSSLGRLLTVAVGRLRAGLEELNVIQNIERMVVTTMRKNLRKKLGEVMESRKEIDLGQQKKELAAWQPVWATMS